MADVSGISSSNTTASGSNSQNALSSNYEMFLTLLTTQLKVQDPLDPMKADQFTSQLVQYSSVEQQIKMNTGMDALLAAVTSSNASNLVGYIGTQVTADGVQSILTDGEATWKFSASDAADDAEVTIRNASGAVVFSEKVDIDKGTGLYVWDGRTTSGTTAPDGAYSISFSAKNSAGNNVSVDTQTSGIVDGIDFSGSEPVLKMGDLRIPLSAVRSVSSVM